MPYGVDIYGVSSFLGSKEAPNLSTYNQIKFFGGNGGTLTYSEGATKRYNGIREMIRLLNSICGVGNYKFELDANAQTLYIETYLLPKDIEYLNEIVKIYSPNNLIVTVKNVMPPQQAIFGEIKTASAITSGLFYELKYQPSGITLDSEIKTSTTVASGLFYELK